MFDFLDELLSYLPSAAAGIPRVRLHSAPIHSYSLILDELLSYLPATAGIPHVWLSGRVPRSIL